jgi:hypothetical protein
MEAPKAIERVEDQLWSLVRDIARQRHLHHGEPIADFLLYVEATLRSEAVRLGQVKILGSRR